MRKKEYIIKKYKEPVGPSYKEDTEEWNPFGFWKPVKREPWPY